MHDSPTCRSRAASIPCLAVAVAAALAALALLPAGARAAERASASALSVTGTWRIYSSTIYYDAGGSVTMPRTSRVLKLKGRTWRFGSSKGRFSIQKIRSSDWRRWDISPYGPTRKVVLKGWSRGTATGPIEISRGRVNFLWAIYSAKRPVVSRPGTIWMKFGRRSTRSKPKSKRKKRAKSKRKSASRRR